MLGLSALALARVISRVRETIAEDIIGHTPLTTDSRPRINVTRIKSVLNTALGDER